MNDGARMIWGREDRESASDKIILDYIKNRFGVGNAIEWDGIYRRKNLEENSELLSLISQCLPPDRISFRSEDRILHSMGKSAMEYASIMDGVDVPIVDAVVYPKEDEIECIMNKLRGKGMIISYGGGTSVTGGLKPNSQHGYAVSLDTRNLNVFNLDERSMVLEAGSGLLGPDIERRLNEHGLTLGNFPESFQFSTLGGWIATNAAGQESNRYGKIRDMVLGIKMISPRGTFTDHVVPAESAFFRVADIGIGSEGAFGIITRAWLKVRRVPDRYYYKAYMFRNFSDGLEALRNEFASGRSRIVARLSDDQETSLSLLAAGDSAAYRLFRSYLRYRGVHDGGSILIVMDDGKIDIKGGIGLGSAPARMWARTRFDRPYLYNELIRYGIIADTIETSVLWSKAHDLYAAVVSAFKNESDRMKIPSIIMCHASHEYVSGTALYFTFLFYSRKNKADTLRSLRSAIMNAILASGGSISHHHGIGQYLSDLLPAYKGSAFELISQLKHFLDPDNMLNPEIIK